MAGPRKPTGRMLNALAAELLQKTAELDAYIAATPEAELAANIHANAEAQARHLKQPQQPQQLQLQQPQQQGIDADAIVDDAADAAVEKPDPTPKHVMLYLNAASAKTYASAQTVTRVVVRKDKTSETIVKSVICSQATLDAIDVWIASALRSYGTALMMLPYVFDGEESKYSNVFLHNKCVDDLVKTSYEDIDVNDRRLVVRNISVIVNAAIAYGIAGLAPAITLQPRDVVPFLDFYSEFTLLPVQLGELTSDQRLETYKLHTSRNAAAVSAKSAKPAAPAKPAKTSVAAPNPKKRKSEQATVAVAPAKKSKPAATKPAAAVASAAAKPAAAARTMDILKTAIPTMPTSHQSPLRSLILMMQRQLQLPSRPSSLGRAL